MACFRNSVTHLPSQDSHIKLQDMKQTLTQHWAAAAQKWNHSQCKGFVCNQHLISLGVPALPSLCHNTEP